MSLSHSNAPFFFYYFFLYNIQCVWLLDENAFLRYLSLKSNMKGVKLSQVQFIAGFNSSAYMSFIRSLVFPF